MLLRPSRSTEPAPASDRSARRIPSLHRAGAGLVLAGSFAWLLDRVAAPGPDLQNYAEWGEAALHGDIFRIGGPTLSPMGVPASVWAPGGGLILSVAGSAAGRMVAWLAAVLFWWSITRLVAVAARGRIELIVLGTALAFVGTHAGYYSTVHATESLALSLTAFLAVAALRQAPVSAADAWTVGAASGLLLLTRPQLLPYAGLACALLLYRGLVAGSLRSVRWWLAALGPSALFLALAAAQLAFVNRWMTGSVLSSPWVFGSGAFSSVDLSDPEWAAVLVHPWHGLLAYHPLYGVAFVALLAGIGDRSASAAWRALLIAVVVVTLSQVFLQAAWFCWWMGTDTFGMRGMSVSSVVLVPLLVDRMARLEDRGRGITGWLLASVAAALWSYLLLLRNDSNFFGYDALLTAQGGSLRKWAPALAVLVVAAIVSARVERRPRAAVLAAASALWALAFLYLAQRAFAGMRQVPALPLAGIALVLAAVLHLLLRSVACGAGVAPRADRGIAALLAVVMVVVTARFAGLAVQTEKVIASGLPPPRPFRHVATVPLQAIAASYREYLRVPGFEGKKAALASYLAAAGALPPPGPPAPAKSVARPPSP